MRLGGAAAGVCLAAAFMTVLACKLPSGRILRTSDGARVSFAEMLEDLSTVPLVVVGELHNSPGHHKAQLEVIRGLHGNEVPLAIGIEMFHDGHQEDLDDWVSGSLAVEDFLPLYYHNWREPWPLYRDIFLFARERKIPMVGLNSSPEISSQVAARGFDSLSPSQLARLPGISCRVDEEYESFIRKALGEHAHGGDNFRYFCEAQMVWDSFMAMRATEHLETNPGTVMVVLAGSGHSWKRGIPAQVSLRSDIPFRTVLPEIDGRLTSETVTGEDTDYLWLGI